MRPPPRPQAPSLSRMSASFSILLLLTSALLAPHSPGHLGPYWQKEAGSCCSNCQAKDPNRFNPDLIDDLVQTESAKTEQRSSDMGQEIFTWPYGKTFANQKESGPSAGAHVP
ncbi:hypothetical protein WJX82_003830 [Trebouxia sp. C0006]